eukprot:3525425-Amphidinium_carterae.1
MLAWANSPEEASAAATKPEPGAESRQQCCRREQQKERLKEEEAAKRFIGTWGDTQQENEEEQALSPLDRFGGRSERDVEGTGRPKEQIRKEKCRMERQSATQ